MVWPPVTHQDVQDEIGTNRGFFADYYRPGYYSTGIFGSAATASSTVSNNLAYARPFWVAATRAFDRIAVNVSTAATAASGGQLALALYAPGLGVPGALVLETATVSTETTGSKEFTIAQTLPPGVWWVATRTTVATCQVTAFTGSASPFVSGGTTAPSAAWGGFTQTGATTAFPTSWGTAVVTAISHMVALRAT